MLNKSENPFQTVTSQEIAHITHITVPFDFKLILYWYRLDIVKILRKVAFKKATVFISQELLARSKTEFYVSNIIGISIHTSIKYAATNCIPYSGYTGIDAEYTEENFMPRDILTMVWLSFLPLSKGAFTNYVDKQGDIGGG